MPARVQPALCPLDHQFWLLQKLQQTQLACDNLRFDLYQSHHFGCCKSCSKHSWHIITDSLPCFSQTILAVAEAAANTAGMPELTACLVSVRPVWLLQTSAASRVHRLAENDKHLKELVDADVPQKLLVMLKPDVDPGNNTQMQ